MHDNAREPHDREEPSADKAALTDRFNRFGERLRHITPESASASRQGEPSQASPATANPNAIARGFRLSTELVVGVLVGAALGWAVDHWLGTSPWGMILFLLLGFVAGVLNVMRAAGVIPAQKLGSADTKDRE